MHPDLAMSPTHPETRFNGLLTPRGVSDAANRHGGASNRVQTACILPAVQGADPEIRNRAILSPFPLRASEDTPSTLTLP
jgi:hypothetical protein